MRIFLFIVLSVCVCISLSAQLTIVSGKATDEDGELFSANVVVYTLDGEIVTGATTDFDGNYSIILESGVYNFLISYIGYPAKKVENVELDRLGLQNLDFHYSNEEMNTPLDMEEICICDDFEYFANPLFDLENTTSGAIYNSDQVRRFR